MTPAQLEAKLSELLCRSRESESVEFKHNAADPQEVGEYISALANSAALHHQSSGYLVWGVEDGTHRLLGTTFKPHAAKGKGNEDLEPWLARLLMPSVDFRIYELTSKGVPVVLIEVPAAHLLPVAFSGQEWIRVGSVCKPLRSYPEKERALWATFTKCDFETGIAKSGLSGEKVADLLDTEAYFRMTGCRTPNTRAKVLDHLVTDNLIVTKGDEFDVTNLGAILFAHDLTRFDRLGRKTLRVIKYRGNDRTQTEREWKDPPARTGYAAGFEAAVAAIDSLLTLNEHIGEALRTEVRVYPQIAIRELVANTLIHQDFSVTGAGPMVEIFDDRLELTNPGEPLVEPQRFIDKPPQSRNETLAGFMRRVNICEERGSGIDKVITQVELFQLPPPDFRVPPGSTRVVLFAPQTFRQMNRVERTRACYQHCVLWYVGNQLMTNSTLRKRFGIAPTNYPMASRVIRDTVDEGLIRAVKDPPKGYVPFWA